MLQQSQIPIPDFVCPSCKEYDWNWDENRKGWKCRVCAMYGRPEPKPPEFDGIENADEWVDYTLRDYDVALGGLENAKDLPQDGQAAKILYMARVKKAERLLLNASMKAEIATLVMQIKKINTQGDIYIDLPEIDLTTRLKW